MNTPLKIKLSVKDLLSVILSNFRAHLGRYLIIILGFGLTGCLFFIINFFSLLIQMVGDIRIQESLVSYIQFVTIICLLLTSVGAFATLVLSITERLDEISLLRLSGAKNRHISTIIIGESIVLSITGYFLALISGVVILTGYLYIVIPNHFNFFLKRVHILIGYAIEISIVYFLFVIVVVLISSIIPLVKALRVSIIEGVTFQV